MAADRRPRRTSGLARWLLVAGVLAAGRGERVAAQDVSVTIYADGRVVVRRTLPAALVRGANAVTVDLGVRSIDPATIVPLDAGVELRGVRVIEATGQNGSLRRALGRDVEFLVREDSVRRYVRGTLLSLDPPAVRVDGRVRYALPGTPVFPDTLVELEPRVELIIETARPRRDLGLLYMTQGLAWSAGYTVLVPRGGSGQGAVTGSATIRNPGAVNLRSAAVQLLAGDVRRAAQGPRPVMAMARAEVAAADAPAEEAVGGTHVYTLPGTVDVVPGEARGVALFAPATALTEPEFVLAGATMGPMTVWPDTMRDLHPEIGYRVRRSPGTPFGQTPLPAGIVRVYEPDSAGRPQLVGEVPIGHTAAGEDLRLVTGTAFDITASRTQTAFERRGQRESVSAYRVSVRNARREAVTVRVQDRFPGSYEVLSSSVPPERVSATVVAFPVRVPPGGEATLEYRVRVRW
jgi:hypothetical protein